MPRQSRRDKTGSQTSGGKPPGLPNTAFKRNANTEVTADVVILKKRGSKEAPRGEAWKKVIPYTTPKGEVISINEYFVENQHMMLGEMTLEGRMYGRNEPTLVSDGRDIKTALAEAIKHLPQNIYQAAERPKISNAPEQAIPAPGHVKPNAYTVHDDQIAIREGDKLIPLPHRWRKQTTERMSGRATRRSKNHNQPFHPMTRQVIKPLPACLIKVAIPLVDFFQKQVKTPRSSVKI